MALKRLNTEHLIAIKYMAMPKRGGLTYAQIADECDVSEQTIYNWRKDPLFDRELKAEMMRVTTDKLPDILDSIPGTIINEGNAAMFKTLLQAHGMLKDRVEVEQKTDAGVDIDELRRRIERYKGEE
jgi:DNA-binding XRE family transcriptional regulator